MSNKWISKEKEQNIFSFSNNNLTISYKFIFNNKSETIVFFYGFGGNIKMVDYFIEIFNNDYNFLYIDYPGHCYSNLNYNYTLNDIVDLIDNLIIKLNIEKFNLIGYSFGGIVSLLVYNRLKNKIKKIILLNTIPYFSYNLYKKIFYFYFKLLLYINFKFSIINISIPILKDKFFSKQDLKNAKEIILLNDKKSVIYFFNMLIKKDCNDILKSIECDTLIIGSKKDFLITEKESIKFANKIKNSKIEILKNIGHLSIISGREELKKIIDNFIKNN